MLKTVLTGGLLSAAIVMMVQDDAVADRDGNNGTNCFESVGPDVIVGDLRGLSSYPSVNGIEAFAIGTESCNIGDEELLWNTNTNLKPVIGQSLYRLKDGRFEQIGQGWLKHGFYALSDNWCECGCDPTDGTVLGVGCSDLYSSGLNGQQSNMGPKYEVNAFTGYYPYPATDINQTGDGIYKRMQARISDLDPAQDGGGDYFVEAQYISPDDAEAGNHWNNASSKLVSVSGSGDSWNLGLNLAGTAREKQVLRFWPFFEPDVELNEVFVENEGMLLVGCKVIGSPDGTWQYEYAVQNYNSDRSISSFELPLRPDATVWDIGFHDVDYHSGSPINGIDWVASVGEGKISWKCTETYEQNEWANAIRWGTTYNFRFKCDYGPLVDSVELGVFKPAAGDSVSMTTSTELRAPLGTTDASGFCCLGGEECVMSTEVDCLVQAGTFGGDWSLCESTSCNIPCEGDITGDSTVDVNDLLAVIAAWNTVDQDADINGDGVVDVTDLLIVIGGWGSCSGG
jgi:hypothetical protein